MLSRAFAGLPVRAPSAAPSATTPEAPLTKDSTGKLLAELEEIDASLRGKRTSYNAGLLPRLNEAAASQDKAFSLWLEATKEQDFELEGRSATEFSDFRNGKAKDLRGKDSFTTQLRLQCRFLALVILQAEAETDAERLTVVQGAMAYLEDYVGAAKKLQGSQEELRRSALSSVIARHLKLDISARREQGPAAYNAGDIGEIYQQMILPYYKEKRTASAIAAAWSRRIAQETALIDLNKVPEQLEKWQKERLPELKWAQARDLFEAGQEESAATAMVGIIKANLAHRGTAGWIRELNSLIKDNTTADPTP